MQTITLNIEGMTCGGCVKSVTSILEGVNGVDKAEVSLENKNAVVEFDPAQTNPAALIEAVEDGGFDSGSPTTFRRKKPCNKKSVSKSKA